MKRHAGLQPLSHDHHHGLVHAYRLSRAAAGDRPVEPVLDDFLAFYPGDLLRHFREEEEVLCPILRERCGPDDEQYTRLLREHEEIHTLVAEARAAREAGDDLLPVAGALGDKLERHIRFEERDLFPRLESLLSEEELSALPAHFGGGPSCAASDRNT